MNRVRVKICGIRSLEEGMTAVEAGADALGFNLWPRSSRYVSPESAREIIAAISPFVSCVGVFVNEDAGRVQELALDLGLGAVQLHGDESPEFCASLDSVKVIKAIRVGPGFAPAMLKTYRVSAILLDTKVTGNYGGTGRRFDWRFAIEARHYSPIILSGGLNEENVAEAIEQVRPAAIDVCSGVEAEPGRKDLDKLRSFMAAVDRANESFSEWLV
jgi:phosphoribosylanthranilate isomerase